MHDVLPNEEYLPAAQLLQWCASAGSTAPPALPALQATHADAPAAVWYHPARHALHADWPLSSVYVPGAQGIAARPSGHAYPGEHATQLAVPVRYDPAWQALHDACPGTSAYSVGPAHAAHADPATGADVPTGHGSHDAALTEPGSLSCPAAHMAHSLAAARPRAGEYRPRGHGLHWAWPVSSWKRPGPHARQRASTVLAYGNERPAGHAVQ